jgi:hypothetical protein
VSDPFQNAMIIDVDINLIMLNVGRADVAQRADGVAMLASPIVLLA